ncbi:peptide synthase [Ectopseudomonas composti]|uniref:Peptide synthase n=2 Tax=Ectopseudomonas composti TaxID=658457 RepID=A0ABP3BXI0_9GAMM|nr:peptide synthase [Pseudomonas composti]
MERLRPWLGSGNGHCRVINSYGPTECTDVVAWHEVNSDTDAALPIGRPVDNTQLYVLDRYDQPLPVGVPGEICIAGAGVGPGYLQREELTAAAFIANPFGAGRLYRTGDLGRYLANGELEFLGRKDFQIKLRGLRIEPGEIEQALRRLDGVRDSLVLVRDERLLAYVLTNEGASAQADWRERLASFIPAYMLPHSLQALPQWPLSANGKIDRRALPQPQIDSEAQLQAPEGEHETRLAELWADILQVPLEQIGRQSNFFHLGGHSLLATVLLTRIVETFAVAPRLRDLFEQATLAEQAQLVAGACGQPTQHLPTLQAGPHPQRLPLSFEQQRLWFLEQLAPGSGEYNINTALTLTGELDVEALRQAFESLVERHSLLRSRLLDDDQGGQLLIDAARRFELSVEDYAGTAADWDAYQRQAAEAESKRAFDLSNEHPLRVRLVRHVEAKQALLLLTLHHCAGDGWSVQVLLDELASSYRATLEGRRAELPTLPVQYVDYALWQRNEARQQLYRQQLEYWQSRLENGDYRLELPTDLPRPANLDNRAGTCFAQLPSALAERLRQFAREHEVTPFMLLLASLKLFLGRYSGQQDLRIGTPVANRRLQAVQPLIGCFVNTLVIRSELTPTQRFGDYLAQVRHAVLEAQEHQDVPFEQVVEHLAPERDLAHTPLFQVAFVMQNSTRASLDWPGLRLQPLDIRSPAAKFDQNWEVHDDGETLSVMLEYRASLFHESTMQAWLGQWLAFLEQLPQAVDTPLAQLTPLSEADRQRQLKHWNDTTRHYPGPATLSESLARQVRSSPEAPALVYEGETLTYAQLHQRADQLAQALAAQGIGREQVVAVCLERSVDLVVALLGIIKVGAAYLPLDPHLPPARLAFLLEDAACPLVLTHATWREHLPEQIPAWCLEQPLPVYGATTQQPANQPGDLLYVLYTSGSTGQPKGVLNEHGALMNRLHWMQDAFAIGLGDRVLQKTPYGFDVSVWEFFWPLITGACLVLARPGGHQDSGYLMELIQRERITTLHFVPSMLQAFVSEPGLEICTSLRQVFASGEALPLALQQRFQARHPARLINLYGPTEAAIDVSCWICDPTSTLGFVPIGKPIANLKLYILDPQLNPLPVGAVGELYIGGAGLARGYLNRPELTAAAFVDSPFEPGQRLYRTGDRCRFLADGNIQYLGRLDHQVKLRGQRIELGEIDAALLAQPDVRDAVTVLRDDLGTPQLVAYLVANETGLDVVRLKAELAQTLPAHMLPSVLVELATLPLNQNGKLDRKQLPRPQLDQEQAALEAPLGEVERRMAARWAELLEVPVELIGRDSHFFRLGGHSLLATMLLARLRQEYGQAPALRQLFEQPTLRAFSALIGNSATSTAAELAPQPRPERLPLSYAQQRLWFLEQLNPHAAEYNITSAVELSGSVRLDCLQQGLADIVSRHEVLRGRLLERGHGAELLIDAESRAHLTIETLTEADWDAQVARRIDDEARRPFDLATGPLLRGSLLHAGQRTLLLLTLHHTVADDWSMQCLIDELAELYRARSEQREARLPALPVQYVDYALWQRLPAQSERYRQQLHYWQSVLGDGDYQLELPTDHPRRAELDTASGFHALVLPDALAQRLRQAAQQQGVTLYVLLLAATQVLLGRLAGQRDVRIGTAVANRDLAQTQALIGCFVNTLVIRAEVDPNQAFEAFLQQVAEQVLKAQEHQEVPFEQIVDALVSQRDMTRTPLFQVLFAMQTARLRTDAWAPLTLREMEVPSNASSFDLSWEVHDDGQRLSLRLKYKRQLFEADTIARWSDAWQRLLGELAEQPLKTLGELDLLGANERERQMQWNATAKAYPGPHNLALALAEQAARSPDAAALVCAEQRLSYAELHARTGAVARELRERGVGREQVVAVCMQRSVEMVVALLGIIRAGAAYLPLDPELPTARLALMLDDASPALTLVQADTASCLPVGTPRWCLDVSTLEDGPQPEPINQPGDLAYVIYTSGSTGQPKGVLNEHGALMNRLHWMQDAFAIGADDRVLQKTPYSFDVSVWEFFWPLITGACLVVAKPDGHRDSHYLAELIQRERITTLHFVPSMLQAFVGEPALSGCTSLRQVFASGEALPLELQQRFQARHPARLINLYGPTEAAIDVSCWVCDPSSTLGFVPIGKPIANLQLYILDEALAPLPIGAVGELYIGGVGLARGYLNRPELTAERFVASPFDASQRLYRTGDRCRFLADGNIQYLGRLDHQVKLRGLRIELGEIDATLLDQPGIEAAVTVLREDLTTPQLVAYLCGPEPLDVEALKQRLGQQLPAHMVPAFMVQLPALPLSSNGKIDRKALPKPEVERPARQHRVPSSATEEVLCRLLGELLGIERPSVDDNFFALGGDSILGLQFIAQARAQGIGLTPRQLFQQRTLADLALVANQVEQCLAEQGVLEGEAPLLPIQHWLLERSLAEPGHWNQSVLLKPSQPLQVEALQSTLQRLVEQHDALRLRFTREGGQWRQRYADAYQAVDFAQVRLAEPCTAQALRDCIAERVEATFDLASGPLIRALLIDLADGQQRLYLVAHHLVVDAVSWRLLLEDFSQLYPRLAAGQSVELPTKVSSYRQWGQRLWQQATSPAVQAQRDYWLQQIRPSELLADQPQTDNRVAEEVSLSGMLSVEETQALQQAQGSYRTQGHELLLAALASALHECSGARAIGIDLEGHGRDAAFAELDVSRTVGWFTQLYPVRLELPQDSDTGALIVTVKEQLRAAADKAMGYGLLRHQAEAPLPAHRHSLLFNYLGQLDGVGGGGLLQLSDEPLPPTVAADSPRSHDLEVVLAIIDGRLQVEMKFAGLRYAPASRERLLQAYLAHLRTVIHHCQGNQTGQLSPTDFPLAKALNQKNLDTLLSKLKSKPISQS